MKTMNCIAALVLGIFGTQAFADIVLLENTLDSKMPYGNGGSFVQMEDGKRAVCIDGEKKQKMYFIWIPEKDWKGKNIRVTIDAKGENLSRGFLFGIQNKDAVTGKDRWDGANSASGTFDWKTFTLNLPMKTKPVKNSLTVRFGVQNTTGKVFFKNLKVTALDEK